jgi:3-methyladenine DNA glycosylase Mpg
MLFSPIMFLGIVRLAGTSYKYIIDNIKYSLNIQVSLINVSTSVLIALSYWHSSSMEQISYLKSTKEVEKHAELVKGE